MFNWYRALKRAVIRKQFALLSIKRNTVLRRRDFVAFAVWPLDDRWEKMNARKEPRNKFPRAWYHNARKNPEIAYIVRKETSPLSREENRRENVVAHLWTHEKRCDITRASSNDNLYAIYKRNNIYGTGTSQLSLSLLKFDYRRT